MLVVLVSAVLCIKVIWADSSCGNLTGDDKKKCEEFEEKAKNYQKIIDLKNQQQDTLEKQLQLIDIEQAQNQKEYNSVRENLEKLITQIENLKKDIDEKEKTIDRGKKILTGFMQSYYEDYQQGVLDIIMSNKSFSELTDQSDYLQQSSLKVGEILKTIQEAKAILEKEKKELDEKKTENEKLKKEMEERKMTLEENEERKNSLLATTLGEEKKYQKMLAKVEEQKLELFDFSSASNLDEVLASVKNYPKPSEKYWASTSWYYSQADSRWGDKKIGNSNTLMKNYGCAVTSVAMVFKKNGASIDPGKLAKQKIYYYDLINWPGSWPPYIELASSVSHGNISWSKIDSEIKKGYPVIVYIKKTNNKGGHYVVIHNKDSKDYIVHDPYFGSNLYLGTSRALVGKIGSDSGTKVDQMIIYH